MKTPLFLLSLLMLMSLISTAGQGQTSNVYGKVVDKETQKPLYGVSVCIKDHPDGIGTITNEKGEFRLWNLPADTVNIIIRCDGYEEVIADVQSLNNQTNNDLSVVYLEVTAGHDKQANVKMSSNTRKQKQK
ncbi:carboxypeptidase-like regulatory domain-containing protein [Sunxiuqinia elliptica]|uniref:Carboxypeptidase-like protein n=1 Tax=Sunxiuqinia elliptica TaxID=655355 RepID=A0A4R6GMC9_9BACT|nr:carboxypeptidase-like regulatory domain-containing protein [Sunxiuqinia elliptica]TDN96246.1 carboxypeptidase-like protein [Sunxiuqinia elliptica]TDO67957.1 carboxypeptidase-like protein [Sunxiuqinia elliptica]